MAQLVISKNQLQEVAHRLANLAVSAAKAQKLVEDVLAGRATIKSDNRICSEAQNQLIAAMALIGVAPQWQCNPEEESKKFVPLYAH